MRPRTGPLAGLVLALVLAAAGAAGAQPGERCSRESLPLDGGALATNLCVAGDARGTGRVTVAATYSRGGATVSRSLSLDVVPGAAATRAIDDVPLDALGVPKRLHVTIVYRDGQATLEHAMLVPGALVLK